MARPTFLTVNLKTLQQNYINIREYSITKVIAMIKAFICLFPSILY